MPASEAISVPEGDITPVVAEVDITSVAEGDITSVAEGDITSVADDAKVTPDIRLLTPDDKTLLSEKESGVMGVESLIIESDIMVVVTGDTETEKGGSEEDAEDKTLATCDASEVMVGINDVSEDARSVVTDDIDSEESDITCTSEDVKAGTSDAKDGVSGDVISGVAIETTDRISAEDGMMLAAGEASSDVVKETEGDAEETALATCGTTEETADTAGTSEDVKNDES
ncbi:hypothetical protein BaRGS_00026007 [Batillaria attramentaria]|uniref:Uncharacterized protein n=1 Tax=Batillaria attramentaria TaxID=370345 RepID=A0ABD0K5Y7_9CAEN